MKRPKNARMEFTVQGTHRGPGLRRPAGLGDRARWAAGSPSRCPPEMAKGLDNQADIEGPLVDYKAKGHQVELVGKQKLERATPGS